MVLVDIRSAYLPSPAGYKIPLGSRVMGVLHRNVIDLIDLFDPWGACRQTKRKDLTGAT